MPDLDDDHRRPISADNVRLESLPGAGNGEPGQYLTVMLRDEANPARTQPVVVCVSGNVEILVPADDRCERAVVRVEVFQGRLQVLVYNDEAMRRETGPQKILLLTE